MWHKTLTARISNITYVTRWSPQDGIVCLLRRNLRINTLLTGEGRARCGAYADDINIVLTLSLHKLYASLSTASLGEYLTGIIFVNFATSQIKWSSYYSLIDNRPGNPKWSWLTETAESRQNFMAWYWFRSWIGNPTYE